jgi:hypothetical protein
MTSRNKPPSSGGYEVGYRKPPKNTRFKPGQSGNASGRPKGRPTLSDLFLRETAKLIAIKKGEEVVRISKAEGLVTKLLQMALQGDMGAMRLAVSLLGQPQLDAGAGNEEAADLGALPDDDAVRRILARFAHLREPGSER